MDKQNNLNKNLLEFYESVKNSRRLDNSFAVNGDIPLTEEEKREIDKFWGKYKFAYPEIDYKSFQTFKNRYGKFDVRHCPGAIRTHYFNKWFKNDSYMVSGQNKAMLPLLYPSIKQPKTVIRRMSGIYYNATFDPLSLSEVVSILMDYAQKGISLIMKPSNKGGGRGIRFVEKGDSEVTIQGKIKDMGAGTFVVQELLEQSDFMKQFNPTSVNTIRATTLLFKGQVYFLAALIRIGKQGNRVDNYSQGGSILGIDKDSGKCNDWALTHSNERISRLPSGLKLNEGDIVVPGFEKIKEAVIKAHYYMPYIKLISWDIALDKQNAPILIENNFAGMIQIHEAVTGPLFGDLMGPLLDTYLLNNFYVEFQYDEWICREFYNGIVLMKYTGHSDEIVIPDKINNKLVTKIDYGAFSECKTINKLSASKRIINKSIAALEKVSNIEQKF